MLYTCERLVKCTAQMKILHILGFLCDEPQAAPLGSIWIMVSVSETQARGLAQEWVMPEDWRAL